MTMKHLLTLTLIAVLGFPVVGCNKSKKVNAATVAATQCGSASDCQPADCPMASAKAKPAAAGAKSACCSSKAKPAAAGTKTSCSSSKAKPAAAGTKSGCDKMKNCDKMGSTGCPMFGGK